MPEFEVVPLDEARLKTANGRQGQIVKQYSRYIEQLADGQAGHLNMGEGEKVTTIRRRLITTARLMGKELVVKRSGDELYFWVKASEEGKKRRRRRAKPAQG
ncbi:MAG: hypothetical protein IIB31_03695 [Chloroflexi bacterium]|nr:hypothetical protein [Chloroflexota bacterium]